MNNCKNLLSNTLKCIANSSFFDRMDVKDSEKHLTDDKTFEVLELVKQKAIENNIPDAVNIAIDAAVEQMRFDHETLWEAKKKLKQKEYKGLLSDLSLYRNLVQHRLYAWYECYKNRHEFDFFTNPGNQLSQPGLNNIYHYLDPVEITEEMINSPLFFHNYMVGYPEEEDVTFKYPWGETPGRLRPAFYGRKDCICTFRYDADGTRCSDDELTRQICDHYVKKGWEPLPYELTAPCVKGGLAGGWRHRNTTWSQCWLDGNENFLNVTLRHSSACQKRICVYITFSKNEYIRQALAFYKQIHFDFKQYESVPLVDSYEDFLIFPIPALGHGLDSKIMYYLDRITRDKAGLGRKLDAGD